MGKTKDLGHLAHIVAYDAENHITVPAGITMHTNQLVASQAWVTTALGSYALSSSLGSYVPTSRTITINGTTYDLSANRNWDITSMIYPAAGIPLSTGSAWGTSITNNSGNWNTAFGWGNHASAGYATTSSLSSYLLLAGGTLTGALNGTSALFTGNLRTDTGLGLKYGSFVSTSGYLNLFSAIIGSTMTLNLKDGTGGFEIALTFSASANRNYTFPAANGTIALTSDIPSLSGYVPTSRTITINGTTLDLSANRSFTVTASETDTLATVTGRGATTSTALSLSGRVTFGSSAADRPQMPGGILGLDTGDGNFDIWGISRDYYPSNPTTANAWGLRWNGANNDFEFVGAGTSRVILDMDSGNVTATGTISASNLSGTNTGDQTNISGNAATANAAAGVSFLTQPNATWGARLQLGGNGGGSGVAGIGVIQATDGNIHIDSGVGKGIYLNYYQNGIIYLNGTTYSISANGSQYNGNAATATNVAWSGVTSKPSHIMYYQSFTLDANTMDANATGFTYAVNAPHTGPIVRFSAGGNYDMWLNAPYSGGGNSISFRTRNGDTSTLNPWREIIHTGNIGSQKVDGSLKFWATTHPNDYYLVNNWTGSHWYITSNHPSPVRVGYADTAGSAPANGGTSSNTNSISNALGNAHDWTNINYFITNNGGQAVNNSNSAKLQAYSSGGNSAFMSFHRGGYYAINMGLDDDNVFRIGGWSASANRLQLDMSGNLTVASAMYMTNAYNSGWFRAYGDAGLYAQDYGCHIARNSQSSHGSWSIWGYTKAGYVGMNLQDPQGYNNNLMFEQGRGGVYQENGGGWHFYYDRPNDCLGLSGSETYDWVRACTNGKHRITNDTWCDAISYATAFSIISDARVKENVITVDNALNKILQLRGVYYNWIIDTEQKKHIGVIAQEVAQVCPEAINYHEETDTYTVSYNDLSGVFIEGVKELNQKLMDANARIELLENKLNQLLNA